MEIVFRLIGFYYLLLYNIALISPHTAGEEVLLWRSDVWLNYSTSVRICISTILKSIHCFS